jgi:predicted exporter
MKAARSTAIVLWLLLCALSALIVARARYSADLSAFLPRSPSASQALLVQQLAQGLASRLILIGIEGADSATRAAVARSMVSTLRATTEFVSVNDGDAAASERDREFIFRHRYQLSPAVTPEHFGTAGLKAAISDNLELLASPAGVLAEPLFRVDPTGETLAVLDEVQGDSAPRSEGGVWASRDGARAVLIAETRAAGSDTDAQAHAVAAIRAAFGAASGGRAASPLRLLLSGPGVFSVEARATIEHEALRLSLISTGLIVALLLCVYRSAPTLLLGLLPVASGALAGVAAVALGFGVVHGITLGFGVTLIGESVDYSIYLFVQSRQPSAPRALWPTLLLGTGTSVCGFASLLPSSFPGLAQLGLYSISGLIAAALVTRFILPSLLPTRLAMADLAPFGAAAARLLGRVRPSPLALLALAVLCAVVLIGHRGDMWNHDIAALSPVPLAAQRLDGELRADIGAPDVSDLVLIEADSEQAALLLCEQAAARLAPLVRAGVLGGFDDPAAFLPSQRTQLERRDSLPDESTLRARLAQASLPLQSEALTPFVQQLTAARSQPDLTRASLEGTSFALLLDNLLWHGTAGWQALLPLHAAHDERARRDIDLAAVRAALAPLAPGHIIAFNVAQETRALYASYLGEAEHLSLLGLAAIIGLLSVTLRSARRVARLIAPLLLAVLSAMTLLVLAGTRLTILHLIGMLLVVAVGSNYALFFDRRATDHDHERLPLTLASLLLANACTVLGFGVLAFSRVPVLHDLGSIVAPGTALVLLFAALLSPRELFRGLPRGAP